MSDGSITQSDFRALAEFRYHIRRFLRFSEQCARDAGIEPQQYLLMLAIKGLPDGVRPRVGEIAERLQIQHHSTVELIDRLEKQAYVQRSRSPEDRREVNVSLTTKGEKLLRELALSHREQLVSLAPQLLQSLRRVVGRNSSAPEGAARPAKPAAKKSAQRARSSSP